MGKKAIIWDDPLEPAKMSDVEKQEKKLRIKLPEDYIACALKNHGASPIPDCLDFGRKQDRVLGTLLALVEGDEEESVFEVYEDIKDRLPGKLVPFADNPSGDYFCFDYRTSVPPTIVYWDHERAFRNPGKAITFVAASFTDLLTMLHEPNDND